MKYLGFVLIFLITGVLSAQENAAPPVPVTLKNTQAFTLHSQGLETTYVIKVYLPEGYETSNKQYPVLYLLDGDHAFAMATDIVTYLQYGGHTPELIIVSPSYDDKHGPAEGGNNQRQRDFSPFKWSGAPADPRAAQYFAFFKDTLITHIDRTYRTLPTERALWGYSRSGLFVLWTLFEKPGVFNKYIVLDTGFQAFAEIESAYHARHNTLDAALYIGYGSLGNGKNDLAFMETLASRNYKKFRYTYQALQGEKHLIIPAAGLAQGLAFIYQK
ncbi:MAG: alpha/beta hydrolase-fold protein [Bacteroidia bacterium]|nr:alpha/beta hydrolase-fold protein [Bacteroidia bacterium]